MILKIRDITFVFENCEAITIDGRYIGDFFAENIDTSVQRVACNAINRIDLVKDFFVEIHKDANKDDGDQHRIFDRLNDWKNITKIEFELYDQYQNTDEGYYKYYLEWPPEDYPENPYQENYLSKDGNLYISVSKFKGIADYVEFEMIDDPEWADFHFDLYDCGDTYGDPERYKTGGQTENI